MKHLVKYFFVVVLYLFSSISCSDKKDKEYENILKALEKNYTRRCTSKSAFLFCWHVDKPTFLKDSVAYTKVLKKIYDERDLQFIKYLLATKNQSSKYNNWIQTINPCSSTITKDDSISNEKATKILIDNLILNTTTDTIIVNNYIDKIKINVLKEVFKKTAIKDAYQEYIKQIKR